MSGEALRSRIADQFGDRGERADIWRALGVLLETEAFLNLGYSRWYQPHALGSSQRRLATLVGETLGRYLDQTDGVRCLDLGCGRGGPAIHLASAFGFRMCGIDLVRYNLSLARQRASDRGVPVEVAVGDATRLPIADASVPAATAVDALVYLPDRADVFAEIARALAPGGVLVLTDLHRRPHLPAAAIDDVDAFAEAWDMPRPGTMREYRAGLRDAGLRVRRIEDLTPHSVGRFRTWTSLFLGLHDGPVGPTVDGVLRHWGLEPETITTQIRRAHDALPGLRHGLVVAERER